MGVTEILADLIRINSVNPEWGGPGEMEVAAYVKRFFEARGVEVWQTEVLPGRANVTAKIPGNPGSRRIVLEAHMDTVSTGDMEIPPFEPEIRDGKIYGRGSVDVKVGLAAMMHAVVEVKDPSCEIWLAAVIDEEHAYRGVLGLIEELPHAAAAIVAEPTENRIVRANKGVLRWRIRTRGKAAHSAKPHLGKNAIYEMARVLEIVENENERLAAKTHPLVGAATCSVGTIRGGTQVNVVPDSCEITIDRRMLPGEKADTILAEFGSALEGFNAEILPPDLVDEAMETAEKEDVVRYAREVLTELGGNPETVGVPFGCDVTKLSRAGIPGIIFGPGSIDQAHAAVEFVELAQVELAANFYRRFLENFH
ncbi:MAG: M20 family metallopeptidase [Verrucomicrobiales bacterium]|nr:M20 family metallopeptidase [Verrucomicrobiales bacterium]